MLVEIFCGLVIYKIVKPLFYGNDAIDVDTADADAIYSVANRLQKLHGGKVYVGLRIPDPDTGSWQTIDIVLVTEVEAIVIFVKNLAGFVSVNEDGSWACAGSSTHKTEVYPDPVAEVKRQVSVLESYLEQRGVALPDGCLSHKVILPNPKCRSVNLNYFPPEVITYDQWVQLKSELKSKLSGWIKGAFRSGKKVMQESMPQQLNFVLSTAPIWDRLELKSNKYVLGDFLEFKGKSEDTQALRHIERSKVSHLIVQKMSMFGLGKLSHLIVQKMSMFGLGKLSHLIVQKTSMSGLAPSGLQVLYCSRDYRNEDALATKWNEVTIRSSTEILFQPRNSTKIRKFNLSSIISMSLSA